MSADTDLTGETFRDEWNTANGGDGRLCHVRGVVDGRLIYRRWNGSKWLYSMMSMPRFNLHIGAIRKPSRKLKAWLKESVE